MRMHRIYPPNTPNTRKESASICGEKNPPLTSTCSRRRTIKLSDRRTDVSKPETPRPNPTAQPGSLQRLVRQSKVHHSKISCQTLHPRREGRVTTLTAASLRTSASSALKISTQSHKERRDRKEISTPNWRSPPNDQDQRPRATDARHGTETQSRGSLHPIC